MHPLTTEQHHLPAHRSSPWFVTVKYAETIRSCSLVTSEFQIIGTIIGMIYNRYYKLNIGVNLLADPGVTWLLHSHLRLRLTINIFPPSPSILPGLNRHCQCYKCDQYWWCTLISHTTPPWPHCSSINGRCWVEWGRMAPCVSSRYKYQSSDNKRCIRGKVEGFCFCVRPDNPLQTYLVLQQNLRVNLFERQKKLGKWLHFLPSSTERLNAQKDIT